MKLLKLFIMAKRTIFINNYFFELKLSIENTLQILYSITFFGEIMDKQIACFTGINFS